MDSSGIAASDWITLIGVVVVFFVMPGAFLELDRRRTDRRGRQRAAQNAPRNLDVKRPDRH